MKKIIALAFAVLSLSSVACSSALETAPMVPSVQKDPVHSPSTPATECHCEGKGGDCVVDGAKKIGEGAWDLTKRGANWVESQAKDEGNQKKASEAWESVKSGASSLYDKAKDAVK